MTVPQARNGSNSTPPGEVRPATLDDAEAVAALLNACSREIVGEDQFATEEIRADWQAPGFDLQADSRVVELPDKRVIGYADLWASKPARGLFWSWARVAPDFRGRCLGTQLNQWVQSRARDRMVAAPVDARVVLRTNFPAKETMARELLEELGMRAVRYTWQMEITLDQPPPEAQWPVGVRVRGRREDELRDIYAIKRVTFADHWGIVTGPFEEDLRSWRHLVEGDPDYDPTLWFLAVADESIIGYVISTPRSPGQPELGWVHSLGVLREWRRRGIALALLRHSFAEFHRRAIRRVGLGVDAESLTRATRLYERAGMHVTQEYVTYEKELRAGRDLTRQAQEG